MVDYVSLFIVKKGLKDELSTNAPLAKYLVAKSQRTRSSLRTTRCDEALGKNELQRHSSEDKVIAQKSPVVFGKNQRVSGVIGHSEVLRLRGGDEEAGRHHQVR